MTRSHSNSKSHARARPKSLPNEASVVMMRRVRVGFLYVTLRLNAAAFSKSVRFLFFSRSILCLNLSLLATLVLSSEDVSYRCARARKHLQSSFLCIICSWTTPREEEISRPHRPRPQHTKHHLMIPFLRFSLFSSVSRVPSAERTWNQSAGPFQRLAPSPKRSASVSFRI